MAADRVSSTKFDPPARFRTRGVRRYDKFRRRASRSQYKNCHELHSLVALSFDTMVDPTSIISGVCHTAAFIHDHCCPKHLIASSGQELTQTVTELHKNHKIMHPDVVDHHLQDRDRLNAKIQHLNDIREKKGRMHDVRLILDARELSKETRALAARVRTTTDTAVAEDIRAQNLRRNTTPVALIPGNRDGRPPNTKFASSPSRILTDHAPGPIMPEAVPTGMPHAYYAEPGEYTNSPPVSPPPQYSYQNPSHSNIYSPTQSPPAFPSPQSETPKFPEPDYGTSPQYTSTYTYRQHSCPDCEQAACECLHSKPLIILRRRQL